MPICQMFTLPERLVLHIYESAQVILEKGTRIEVLEEVLQGKKLTDVFRSLDIAQIHNIIKPACQRPDVIQETVEVIQGPVNASFAVNFLNFLAEHGLFIVGAVAIGGAALLIYDSTHENHVGALKNSLIVGVKDSLGAVKKSLNYGLLMFQQENKSPSSLQKNEEEIALPAIKGLIQKSA